LVDFWGESCGSRERVGDNTNPGGVGEKRLREIEKSLG
jgi:hypothetical protein